MIQLYAVGGSSLTTGKIFLSDFFFNFPSFLHFFVTFYHRCRYLKRIFYDFINCLLL